MLWLVLTAVIFLALIARLLSSSWYAERRAASRPRRIQARRARQAARRRILGHGALGDTWGAGGFSGGADGGSDAGGGADGGGCD